MKMRLSMKKTNIAATAFLAIAAFMMPCAARAAANGDIFEIFPVNADGTAAAAPTERLDGGDTVRFAVRLMRPAIAGAQFRLVHTGVNNEAVDWAVNRPAIGIYVNGVLTLAYLENVKARTENLTDFIFSYVVKPGDFALPVRLADANKKMVTDSALEPASAYYLNFLDTTLGLPAWKVDDSTETLPATREANFFYGDLRYGLSSPDFTARQRDFDLSKCNFNIQTVDFDTKAESADCWRSVHEHSSAAQPVGAVPSIVVSGMPTNSVTLYVWSENPEAVELIEGRDVQSVSSMSVHTTADATEQRKVGVIKIVAGKDKYEFNLRGVSSTNDATIVLSAQPDFIYNSGLVEPERLTNYVFRTVRCIGPQPASVSIAPASDTVTATSDYDTFVTTLDVAFSENPLDHAVEVEIVPAFTDAANTGNWWEYVRISASSTSDPTLLTPAGNPILVFNAGSTVPSQIKIPLADGTSNTATVLDGKLYLYALRSDSFVTGAKKMTFAVRTTDAEALKPSSQGGIDGWNTEQSTLTINATDPVIESMFDGTDFANAVAGYARTLQIVVSDVYADMNITNGGYQIWIQKNTDSDTTFTQLEGLYYPGKGNVLFLTNTTDKLPSVVYSEPVTNKSVVYVVSPVSGNQSANHNFQVAVSTPAGYTVVTTDGEEEYKEGDQVQVQIELDKQNTQGDIYAYIKGETDEATEAIDCTWKAAAGGKGRKLSNYATSLSSGCKFTLTDGSTKGSDYSYEIIFLTEPEWTDAADKRVTSYQQKGTLVLTVFNVIPSVDTITLGRYDISENESTVGGEANPAKFPLGITNEFSLVVNEPGELDKTSTNEPFQVRWVFTDETGMTYSPTEPTNEVTQANGIVEGNPDETTCKFDFPSAGKWTVTVDMKDKDMTKFGNGTAGSKFTFYVHVIDQPAITIETSSPYYEQNCVDFGGDASLKVNLDINNCTFDFWVNLAIVPNTTGAKGTFLLQESDNVVRLDDGSYNVKIPRRTTSQTIFIKTLDGTTDTRTTGFSIIPTVATNDGYVVNNNVPNSGNKKVSEYYLGVAAARVLVINDAPLLDPEYDVYPVPGTNAIASAIGAADEAITWTFNDVELDFTRGITVEFKGGGGWGPNTYTNRDDAIAAGAAGFIPTFNSSGSQSVKLTIKDPDGGTQVVTWLYEIEAAKSLTLVAHGPASGDVSKYDAAAGLGSGRVWAESRSAISANSFASMINCGKATSIKVFGYGYKVGDVDDGTNLHAPDGFGAYTTGYYCDRDTPLDTTGANLTTGTAFSYIAPLDARGNSVDSFLYTWMVLSSESDKEGGSGSGGAAAFQMLNSATAPEYIAVPRDSGKTVTLPGNSEDDGNYPDTLAEAIFSIEYLASDNMGDINLDGVPDAYVNKYGFELVDTESGQATGTDLTKLNTYNTDEDYLPAIETSSFGTLIPGLAGSWVTLGKPFTAKLEIRGNGESLNDASENNAFVRLPNMKSDRVYTDPRTDLKSTLDGFDGDLPVEYLAWLDFAAANGLDPADKSNWTKWSPERPTDPMVEDTDADGLPDGYEYFIWYRAHVGYNDGGRHKYLTGRAYDPRNPGDGKFISNATIAAAIDPVVANAAFSETLDTDNDGLPDLIEFEIGTNPFDFDTDGDGLPDGFELMLAGTSPLLAYTTVGISDAMRNFDGDAMAYSSPTNEALYVVPPPKHIKSLSSFALVDPRGDTDGIQWYVLPSDETPTNIVYTDDAEGYVLNIRGDRYVTTVKPAVVSNDLGVVRLAADLDPAFTWALGVYDVDTNTVRDVRLMPTRLTAGTQLDEMPDLTTKTAYGYLAFGEEVVDSMTAWQYGRRWIDTTTDTSPIANVGGFGFLALGRYQNAPSGMAIAALPAVDNEIAYLHYLVYQEFLFDPRTAWNANTPLGARWGSTVQEDGSEVIKENNFTANYGYAGISARTREYTLYDEFLVLSFFLNGNKGATMEVEPSNVNPWHKIWSRYTTNGRGPKGEEDLITNGDNYIGREGEGSDNGADTDGDGVPDGWELYVMSGPKVYDNDKKKYFFVFAGPENDGFLSSFGPFVGDAAKINNTDNTATGGYATAGGDGDGLTELQEFAGTDTTLYYADFSTTIVRPDEHKTWINKFFPTDPWNGDTDGDGIGDSGEKGSFSYGVAADNGKLVTVPGGGLNPLSVDTDFDGLPDPWESQFKGSTVYDGEDAVYATGVEEISDGGKGNPLQGLIDGMDGTVPDAYTIVNGSTGADGSVSTWTVFRPDGSTMFGNLNRDYDNDGLENWQEYMVGTMRCWRYDDPFTGWDGIPDELYWDEFGNFSPDYEGMNEFFGEGTIDTSAADGGEAQFWYNTLVDKAHPMYNPRFVSGQTTSAQYFSRVTNVWDVVYRDDSAGAAYYYFKDHINGESLTDLWAKPFVMGVAKSGTFVMSPKSYISCSPVKHDTDQDGMDDYYELFHGMNPLLGAIGVKLSSSGPCDVVYDAWSDGSSDAIFVAWNESDPLANMWTYLVSIGSYYKTGKAPRGNGFDFEYYPWLNGMADADPDGDDIRNQSEAIMPRLASATWLHTDPTPLWMTDTAYDRSLTRLYFRMPGRDMYVPTPGDYFVYGGTKFEFKDFGGWAPEVPMVLPARFVEFSQDLWWGLYGADSANWIASFEENEGYDSDQDAMSDRDEIQAELRAASDPQEANSPNRRQAMYFQGPSNPSALQLPAPITENYPIATVGYPDEMTFFNFTVECWAMAESLDDATLVERAVCSGYSKAGDEEFVRKNFQLGIKNGKWYAKFDSNGTLQNNSVELLSNVDAEVGVWHHIAATFDGGRFVLYVDGAEATTPKDTSLQPEYGSSAVIVYPTGSNSTNLTASTHRVGDYWYDVPYTLKTLVVGASLKTRLEGGSSVAFDVENGAGWKYYNRFFTGYIDEIRIWDGARKAADIRADVASLKRYTRETALENRSAFYKEWTTKGNRYGKDGQGEDKDVIPELVYHFSFDSVPGGADESVVAKSPNGFEVYQPGTVFTTERGAAHLSRPVDWSVGWWENILNGYGSVYSSSQWVQWVPNTLAHLPRFDGTTYDTFFWSDDTCGSENATVNFPHTAEPASRWVQMIYNQNNRPSLYYAPGFRHHLICTLDGLQVDTFTNETANVTSRFNMFLFTGRNAYQNGANLLPLGGAYAKSASVMWDSLGASTAWEVTSDDADGNNLPDTWEQYAISNYKPESEPITWTTMVEWKRNPSDTVTHRITAGEAYRRDLANGRVVAENADGDLDVVKRNDLMQTADEDSSKTPDWWDDLYGVYGKGGTTDSDNDGLSNYTEYMASEYFRLGLLLNPTMPKTDAKSLDYFLKIGSLYLGAMFTDHDFMEDWWERSLDNKTVDANVWDADRDGDEDGWSNADEARYNAWCVSTLANLISHAAGDTSVLDVPQPALKMTVRYNGNRDLTKAVSTDGEGGASAGGSGGESEEGGNAPTLRVITYTDKDMVKPDAEFAVQPGKQVSREFYIGGWEDRTVRGTLDPGSVEYGNFDIFFAQLPQDDMYSWIDGAGMLHVSRPYSEFKAALERDPNIIQNVESFDWRHLEPAGYAGATSEKAVTVTSGGYIAVYGERVGKVDLITGDFEFDLSAMAKLSFKAFYEGNPANAWGVKEAIYKFTYTAKVPDTEYYKVTASLVQPEKGFVKGGVNSIFAYWDVGSDGAYTPGVDPCGVVRDINLGWRENVIELELTDTSAITPRIKLWESATSDRIVRSGLNQSTNNTTATVPTTEEARVRVIRFSADDWEMKGLGEDYKVVFDRTFLRGSRDFIHEGDFLVDGEFDIGWSSLEDDIVSLKELVGDFVITNVGYAVVFGDAAIDRTPTSPFRNIDAHPLLITRRYEAERTAPVAASVNGESVCYTAQPTFNWRIDGEDKWASMYGTTYTAFKVKVMRADDNVVVYDSGYQRMPAPDSAGVYSWTAPLYVDCPSPSGEHIVFSNLCNYKWQVFTYNAKFKTDEAGSEPKTFRMNVTDLNESSYSLGVNVSYVGPAANLAGRIRVQAFTSPDFSGVPVSAAVVADVSDEALDASAGSMVVLKGLRAGTYFLKAYIDTDNDHVLDGWESWGYLSERDHAAVVGTKNIFNVVPVTVGPDIKMPAPRQLFIEDRDTDGDGFPDVWEAEQNAGVFDSEKITPVSGDAELIAVNPDLAATLDKSNQGYASTAFNALASAEGLAMMTGLPVLGAKTMLAAGAVPATVVADTVSITSMSIDRESGEVVLGVAAETAADKVDPTVAGFYSLKVAKGAAVTVKVYRTATLAEKWELVSTQKITISATATDIRAPLAAEVDLKSGFFKVEVEQ